MQRGESMKASRIMVLMVLVVGMASMGAAQSEWDYLSSGPTGQIPSSQGFHIGGTYYEYNGQEYYFLGSNSEYFNRYDTDGNHLESYQPSLTPDNEFRFRGLTQKGSDLWIASTVDSSILQQQRTNHRSRRNPDNLRNNRKRCT